MPEDIAGAFPKSPHHVIEADMKRDSTGHACESCHGPGQKHAESADATSIRNPAKLTAAATDRVCLGCHLNQPTHVGRLQSSHAKDAVAWLPWGLWQSTQLMAWYRARPPQ